LPARRGLALDRGDLRLPGGRAPARGRGLCARALARGRAARRGRAPRRATDRALLPRCALAADRRRGDGAQPSRLDAARRVPLERRRHLVVARVGARRRPGAEPPRRRRATLRRPRRQSRLGRAPRGAARCRGARGDRRGGCAHGHEARAESGRKTDRGRAQGASPEGRSVADGRRSARGPARRPEVEVDMPIPQHGKEAIHSLRQIPLFAKVSDADLRSIAQLLIERRFPKNKTIVEEGLPGDYMYVIREGRVKVTKLSGDGREKILELLGPGDFFGEMSLLDNAERSASVKTLGQTRILALSRADFLNELRRSTDLAMAVIQELTRRVRQMDEQASSLSFQRVRERTQGLLQRLAREGSSSDGRRITPSLTHQQIADMIGTSRETVTRVLKVLKDQGWLAQEGKHYLVSASPE